ncbi:MAG TPA: hypothetical protein V6D22_17005 [Candidatus Obscuribacterales bacterium]
MDIAIQKLVTFATLLASRAGGQMVIEFTPEEQAAFDGEQFEAVVEFDTEKRTATLTVNQIVRQRVTAVESAPADGVPVV